MTDDTQEIKHTPTPWKKWSNGEVMVIRAPDGSRLCQLTYLTRHGRRDADEVSANAQRIVTAVNAYEYMLEALKPFAKIAELESKAPAGATVMVNISRIREAAAALALAEGKEGGAGE